MGVCVNVMSKAPTRLDVVDEAAASIMMSLSLFAVHHTPAAVVSCRRTDGPPWSKISMSRCQTCVLDLNGLVLNVLMDFTRVSLWMVKDFVSSGLVRISLVLSSVCTFLMITVPSAILD